MIVILDLGGANTTYLARKIRSLGVYSEILPGDVSLNDLKTANAVEGIIINGTDDAGIRVSPDISGGGFKLLAFGGGAPGNARRAMPDSEAGLDELLKDFIFGDCAANADWNMESFIKDQTRAIKEQTRGEKVLLALSGGVDSSVVAALLAEAIGVENTICVHVNHGLMRKGEPERVIDVFGKKFGDNFIYVDAGERFLSKLTGVSDPESKRGIIGKEFIDVFGEEADKLKGVGFLAQGTIYPDIVESGTKARKLIKSHHNVALPANIKFKLIEPLKQLFKDEVRACGTALGLPHAMLYSPPFPGPGLGVRTLGAVTRERLEIARESDAVLREEFVKEKLDIWQYFTVVPDVKSTGIKNEARSFEYPVIIRAVNSVDAMTASVPRVDWDILEKVSQRILNEVPGVNRVCYDLTVKPPGTIEWE